MYGFNSNYRITGTASYFKLHDLQDINRTWNYVQNLYFLVRMSFGKLLMKCRVDSYMPG